MEWVKDCHQIVSFINSNVFTMEYIVVQLTISTDWSKHNPIIQFQFFLICCYKYSLIRLIKSPDIVLQYNCTDTIIMLMKLM